VPYPQRWEIAKQGKPLAPARGLLRIFALPGERLRKGAGSLAFSPSGQLLAASFGKTLSLWRVADGTLLKTIPWRTSQTLAFAEGESVLAAVASDASSLCLWRGADGAMFKCWKLPGKGVAAISPNGNFLAFGGELLQLFALQHKSDDLPPALRLEGHEPWPTAVAFSEDGQWVASMGFAGFVGVWELSQGRLWQKLAPEDGVAQSVALSRASQLVAVGMEDGVVWVWRVPDGSLRYKLQGHGVPFADLGYSPTVVALAFAPDGQLLASGSSDETIKLWSMKDGRLLATLEGHEGEVLKLAFSPDGSLLASLASDGTVRLWDVARVAASPTP
jgi:WD40 repeat protein